MLFLKLLHHINEGFNTLFGHGIVNGCSESTHGAVPLDAYHASGSGKLTELGFQVLILLIHYKTYIHNGTVFFVLHGGFKELVALNFVVKHGGLRMLRFSISPKPPCSFNQMRVCRAENTGNTGGVLNIEPLSIWVL